MKPSRSQRGARLPRTLCIWLVGDLMRSREDIQGNRFKHAEYYVRPCWENGRHGSLFLVAGTIACVWAVDMLNLGIVKSQKSLQERLFDSNPGTTSGDTHQSTANNVLMLPSWWISNAIADVNTILRHWSLRASVPLIASCYQGIRSSIRYSIKGRQSAKHHGRPDISVVAPQICNLLTFASSPVGYPEDG